MAGLTNRGFANLTGSQTMIKPQAFLELFGKLDWKISGNRERRNWFPAGDQSNGMAVKRDLRINFRPIGCSALIMRWFCRKTQEKHENKFLNGYYSGVTNELNLVHDIIPTDWNEKPWIQNPIHISKRKEILSQADCYIRQMCNSKQIK